MPKASTKEQGKTGVEISSGVITRSYLPSTILGDDYLSAWTVDTVQRMLADGQTTGVWNAIRLSLLQSDFDLVPYIAPREKDPSKEDRQIAEWVEKQLQPLWLSILDHALNCLKYGFMLFEPIHKYEDGLLVWDYFAPRMPWTVSAWKAKKGYVDSVTQYAWDNDTERYDYFPIEGRNLLRFTHNQEGENFEGRSFFRGAHFHWMAKTSLYKLALIFFERWAAGLPVGALPVGTSPETAAKFKEVLQDTRSNEAAYLYLGDILEPGGISIDDMFKILTPENSGAGPEKILEHIHHHDVLIGRSMMAEFMNLGETDAGTRALSSDKVDLFLMNLDAISKYIAHVISVGNRGEYGGIRGLVDLNFKNVRGYPVWRCRRTKKTDSAQISAVIAQLVQSGAMEPDDSLENYLRGTLGIPLEKKNPRPVKTVSRQRTEQQPVQATERFAEVEHQDPFEWERFTAFEEIEQSLNQAEDEVIRAWREIFRRQLDLIGQEFDGGQLTRKDISKISKINMPLVGTLANRLESIFVRMYRQGQLSVRGEIRRQLQSEEFQEDDWELEEEEALALIAAQADSAAARLSDKVKGEIQGDALLALGAAAVVSWQQIRDRAWMISDSLYARPESFFVDSAFGMGRNEEIERHAEMIEERYYSALLDFDTCEVCAAMDGARYSEMPFITPNPHCMGAQYSKSGGNPCRCLTVIELVQGSV